MESATFVQDTNHQLYFTIYIYLLNNLHYFPRKNKYFIYDTKEAQIICFNQEII